MDEQVCGKLKWYLSTEFISLLMIFSWLVIPFIAGVILIIAQHRVIKQIRAKAQSIEDVEQFRYDETQKVADMRKDAEYELSQKHKDADNEIEKKRKYAERELNKINKEIESSSQSLEQWKKGIDDARKELSDITDNIKLAYVSQIGRAHV